MGLWGLQKGVWYRVKEFYFNSREQMRQMTDEEYAGALEEMAAGRRITAVIVDPSAASFIQVLKRRGWKVRPAKNEVLSGIRATAQKLKDGKIVICDGCVNCLREMEEYVWDLRDGSRERVRKEHDHAMDDMRYFVATALSGGSDGFVVGSVERKA